MNKVAAIIVIMVASFSAPRGAAAQELRGTLGFGLNTDLNDASIPQVGGGAVLDLAKSWVSIGGQSDLFMSNGYFGGRAQAFGQAKLLRGSVRPFLFVQRALVMAFRLTPSTTISAVAASSL